MQTPPQQSMITAPVPSKSWLTYTHPFYDANIGRWSYARDHYTGDVIDPKKVLTYLVKRATGESAKAYEERCTLADYTNHFAEVVESLIGILTAVEPQANRVFRDDTGHGLGDPQDPGTPIGALWARADREGNGYLTVWKMLGIELAVCHFAWVFIDNGAIRILPAVQVPNWLDDGTAVVIKERVDARGSLRDSPSSSDQFIVCTIDGWQRWRLDSSGREVMLGGAGNAGTWSYRDKDGNPALPVFPVALPMKRPVGYQLAKKCNAIFNKESERDHLLRVANFPRLVLAAGDDLFGKLTTSLAKGDNIIQEDPAAPGGGHRYIAPGTESATVAGEVIKQKVEHFHKTAHKAYDAGAGAEKTATEVRQDVASGTGAFLQMVKSALDDAENSALWRLEQALRVDQPKDWWICRVERSEDFAPADPAESIERQNKAGFGEGSVPLGHTALVTMAKAAGDYLGIEPDDVQLQAAVALRMVTDALEAAPTLGLELPPEIKADLTAKVLIAAGIVDSTDEAAMKSLKDTLVKAAEAAAVAKEREAEALGLMAGGGRTKAGNQDADDDETGDGE